MPQEPVARPRFVMIAPAPPRSMAPDAGTRYITLLTAELGRCGEVMVLVPDFDAHRSGEPMPTNVRVLRANPRLATTIVRRAHLWAARFDPSLPYLPFVLELLRADVRRTLATADVVDLQYAEMARLAGLVRRINPQARIVATHHDVLPERYARFGARAPSLRQRIKWRWAARLAERAQARSARHVDATLTFSDKDAALLARSGLDVTVVLPPMATETPGPLPLAERDPLVIFVGYLARPENDDAAHWLLDAVWPAVADRVPDARLRLVGSGATAALTTRVASRHDVALTGFVADLASEYAGARACVVPLREGAGVKFKTIEAMAAGVPVVTTTLGLEGISGSERVACVADDAAGLADGLSDALIDPDEQSATATRLWAQHRFGSDGFRDAVRAAYAPGRAR